MRSPCSTRAYGRDVLRLAIPIGAGGVLSYFALLAEVAVAAAAAGELLGAIGLAAVLMSIVLSGVMALMSANQAVFARHSGTAQARLLAPALVVSLSLGGLAFWASPWLLQAIARGFMPGYAGNVAAMVDAYLAIARFSFLLAPVLMAVKGALNGGGKASLALRITAVEGAVKLFVLSCLAYVTWSADHEVSLERMAGLLALGTVVAEAIGLVAAAMLLTRCKAFLGISAQALKQYLVGVRSFMAFSALQNVVAVAAGLYFAGLLSAHGVALVGVFRAINSIFNFNRLIFSGFCHGNAIVAVQRTYAAADPDAAAETARYTAWLSGIGICVALMLAATSVLTVQRIFPGADLLASCLFAAGFGLEGASLVVFRLLLHTGHVKAVSIIGTGCLLLGLVLLPGPLDAGAVGLSALFATANGLALAGYWIVYLRSLKLTPGRCRPA